MGTLKLDEFANIFAEPTGLLPERARDHHIHLLLGTTLVAVRRYCYTQLLKDKLEKKCVEMA